MDGHPIRCPSTAFLCLFSFSEFPEKSSADNAPETGLLLKLNADCIQAWNDAVVDEV